MECTQLQREQVEVLLAYAFNEIQLRSGQRKAVISLAYACHNLPTAHRNPYFDLDYFRKWFGAFHDEHGFMYDYLSMLDAIGEDVAITGEMAIGKWGSGLNASHPPTEAPPAG